MKKFLNGLLYSKPAVLIYTALSALALLVYYSFRTSFVFVDKSLFSGFSLMLFVIALLNTFLLTSFSVAKMKASKCCDKKAFKIIQFISEVFAVVFAIVAFINIITAGSETLSVAVRLCKQNLPLWTSAVIITAALFIVPNIKNGAVKKTVAVIMTAVMVFGIYSAVFPVTPFSFTSGPVVFDNGTEYCVAFSTNDNGAAYIEYEYEGESIRVYDSDNGRKTADVIHKICVPYEHLNGNTYQVFAARVIDELSYGGRSGKTIESEKITFNSPQGDDFSVLSVSDWHTHNKLAEETVLSNFGAYEAVILLGDCSPGMMFKEEVSDYLLSFASDLTKGEIPVIFARGNHETRGGEADSLASYIGYDNFYYTAKLGNYNFIVLDSGEDKEDSHVEYGGMVVYEQNRKEMVEWLETLENDDNAKTIALSHDYEICIEDDLSERAHNKLDELNVSFLVSGHWHTTDFIDTTENIEGKTFNYPILIDGGINADGSGTFVASMLYLSNDKIDVKAVSSDGDEIISETAYWR